jgi:hypothetical protein
MKCHWQQGDMRNGLMTQLEAIEETLEVLSQLQLNGLVKLEDSDKMSQCIQHLYTIRFNLKMKENQNV